MSDTRDPKGVVDVLRNENREQNHIRLVERKCEAVENSIVVESATFSANSVTAKLQGW